MATTSTDVADDIVPLILSFLPSKSLLRFRAVCRSWRDMISDPRFLRMHLDQSKKRLSQNLFVRIPSQYYPDEVDRPHPFSSVRVRDQGFQPEADLGSPGDVIYWAYIECTCDGVMLIEDYDRRYMLWNPFTQKKTFFPKHPHKFYPSSHFGICYDPKTMDDFKVVAICHRCYTVHSCKSGSWSDKKTFPYSLMNITPGPGIFGDGAIYWVVRNGEGLREIVWFDRINDDFKTLSRPEQVEAGVEFELVWMRGCLCLYYQTVGDQFHIWVKEKEQKTGACWKELIVVENVQCLEKPLCILENNNIVIKLKCGRRYEEYSPCDKTFRQFEVMTRGWRMAPCVQSLLFPSMYIAFGEDDEWCLDNLFI